MNVFLEEPVYARVRPIAVDVALRSEVGDHAMMFLACENGQTFRAQLGHVHAVITRALIAAHQRRIASNGHAKVRRLA